MIYDALAPIYDRVMSHVEYEAWSDFIGRIVEKYCGVSHPSIFELGGGTGVLGALLKRKGYPYAGSDRSFSMCRQAKNRAAPFVCADALSIPLKRPVDFLVFLYDGINYLQTLEEYGLLFTRAAACLRPGGLFLFDITTEANSLKHFQSYLEFEDWGDYAYVRRSYYSKEKIEQRNDFTIFRNTGGSPKAPLYEKKTERHSQKVFAAAAIAQRVPRELFSVEGLWDGFTFDRYRPHSERVHFLLKKSAERL